MGLRFLTSVAAFVAATIIAPTARAECTVRGTPARFGRVSVKVDGARAFELFVAKAPMRATLHRFSPTEFEVEEPLMFRAKPLEHVTYAFAKATASEGIATFGDDAVIIAARALRDEVEVDVDLSRGIIARGADVDCGALTLSAPTAAPREDRLLQGRRWAPAGRVLTLHERPGAGRTLRLEMDRPGAMQLVETADQRKDPTWIHVVAQLGGTTLRGWVARSALGTRLTASNEHGSIIDGGCGFSTSRSVYLGPAKLEKNTPVLTEPDGKPWALVESNEGVIVMHPTGSRWVQIVEAAGLRGGEVCKRFEGAYVRRSAVTFPNGIFR